MVLLGAVMAARPPTRRLWKGLYVSGFVVLGALGMYLVVKQSNETAESQRVALKTQSKFDATLAGLGRSNLEIARSNSEIARIQKLNTELQGRLLDASHDISNLSQSTLDNITGADAYAYIVPQDHSIT